MTWLQYWAIMGLLRRRGSGGGCCGLIALVGIVVIVIVIIGALSGIDGSSSGNYQPGGGGGGGLPSVAVSSPVGGFDPGSAASSSPEPSASPSLSDPLAGASAGDCYANNGTEDNADWQSDSGCQTGDFKVVQVESDTTDSSSACGGVQNWDLAIPDDAGDQVLCMAYQDASPAYEATPNQCVFGPPGSGQTWNFESCGTGNFTVDEVYRDTTDTSKCGSGSDEGISFEVSGYPDIDKVLCLSMNYPWISTVQMNGCVWESGSGSDVTFSNVSSCDEANRIVTGRVFQPNDGSFCGQWGWYTWQSGDYPSLGVTVCLGSP